MLFLFSVEFLEASTNLFLSTATDLDKVSYPMLKHLPRSGMEFLFLTLIFCGHYIPFLPFGTHLFFPSIKWETSSTLLPSLQSIFFTSCVSRCLNLLFYLVCSYFWSLTAFSLPTSPFYSLDGLLSVHFRWV